MQALQLELEALDEVLAQRGWQDQRVRLLMTLPGVDVTVAEAVLAALGDIERFRTQNGWQRIPCSRDNAPRNVSSGQT